MKAIKKLTVLSLQLCLGMLLISPYVSAQTSGSQKQLGPKTKSYYDSLKTINYDRVFPLLGAKVYKRGFDVPYPFGIMVNYFYARQGVVIDNIKLGFEGPNNTIPPIGLDSVIKFQSVEARAQNINIRADLWVLPFLNVYGIFGYSPKVETEVTLAKPISFNTTAKQTGYNYGFGVMGAGGFGPLWLQADVNINWANMELLSTNVLTYVSGIRMGHTFVFPKDPTQNFAIWAGAMYVNINSNTEGKVLIDDVVPDISQEKIDEIKASYSEWYDGLRPAQKEVVDKIMESLQEKVDGHPIRNTYVSYQMDKRPKQSWAGLVGMQYQFNKHWMARVECNFIGDRFSVLTSLNYRFLGFKKRGM